MIWLKFPRKGQMLYHTGQSFQKGQSVKIYWYRVQFRQARLLLEAQYEKDAPSVIQEASFQE